MKRLASSPPFMGPHGPDAKPGLTELPSSGQRHWTSSRGRDSMVHRSVYGPLGNDLVTDLDGFVPEPGDRWQDFSRPESMHEQLWAGTQAGEEWVETWWSDFVAKATRALRRVEEEYATRDAMVRRAAMDDDLLRDSIQRLQHIDYGHATNLDEVAEGYLLELEDVTDTLARAGVALPELDEAIRYFLTDPELSRSYLYGPTDRKQGLGAIDILIEALDPESHL